MNKKRPLALLAVGLFAALTVVGVGYALWFQVLTINAEVTTSNLDVQWTGLNCSDNEPDDPFDVGGFPQQTKDVGDFDDNRTPYLITVVVTNAYPGYAIDCELEWDNVGQVPVHLERWVLTVDDPDTVENPDWFYECLSNVVCESFPGGPDLYELTPDDAIYARLNDPDMGCQYETGQGGDSSFIFGVRQPAKENTSYVLKLYGQFNQWNESAWKGFITLPDGTIIPEICNLPFSTPVVPVLPLDASGTPYDPIFGTPTPLPTPS